MSDYPHHLNLTRKYIIGFLEGFDNLTVEKMQWDVVTSAFTQRKVIPVPVTFFSKEKLLQILQSSSARKNMDMESNNAPVELQIILPRVAATLQGIVYDTERHLNKTHKIHPSLNPEEFVYAPVPYSIEIEVSTLSRTLDDAFQMMEMILPQYTPTRSMDIKILDIATSIPISLNSVSFDFPQEIVEEEERLYTVSYYFTIRAEYYNISKLAKRILKIDMNLLSMEQAQVAHNEQVAWEKYTVIAKTPLPTDYPNTPKEQIPITETWTTP